MTQPYSRIDTFTSAGQGEGVLTKTHSAIGLFVELSGSVTEGDVVLDVTIEGSPNGDYWTVLDPDSDPYQITEADLSTEQTGPLVQTAYRSDHHNPVEMVRANVRTLDPAGAELETHIFMSKGGQRGVQYNRSLDL